MSGIEIAGLVLGAFPLLLYALDNYRKGAEGLTEWWRIQRTFKKCHQDLSYHQILFEGNVERFLLPLVVDDDELRALMADPAGEGWEDAELETRLQQRLPKSYSLFLSILGDINDLVESLKKELGVSTKFQARLNQSGELLKADGSRKEQMSMANFEFQAKRIKFTVRKSARERLFTQLQEANERMRKLLESSDQITVARQKSNNTKLPSSMHRKIKHFWRHAQRLHDVLANAWQCNCASHEANLGLEHRTSGDVEFDVFFRLAPTHKHPGWQGTRIKMVTNPSSPISTIASDTRPICKQVRWSVQDTQESLTAIKQTIMIQDLCSTLSMNHQDLIGFLQADEHRFMLYPANQISSSRHLEAVTLKRLLQAPQNLTRRRRYFLALTLASSYLQLGATPWLNMHLRKESIIFLQDPAQPQSDFLEHPYIHQELKTCSGNPATGAIASLGIRLLELCFGTPLEATQFRKQLPVGDETLAPIFDYTAAIQWSRLVSEEAGPEFADAIEWCLHCKEVGDDNWRKDLWDHVVVPLDACHKQVSQKPMVL